MATSDTRQIFTEATNQLATFFEEAELNYRELSVSILDTAAISSSPAQARLIKTNIDTLLELAILSNDSRSAKRAIVIALQVLIPNHEGNAAPINWFMESTAIRIVNAATLTDISFLFGIAKMLNNQFRMRLPLSKQPVPLSENQQRLLRHIALPFALLAEQHQLALAISELLPQFENPILTARVKPRETLEAQLEEGLDEVVDAVHERNNNDDWSFSISQLPNYGDIQSLSNTATAAAHLKLLDRNIAEVDAAKTPIAVGLVDRPEPASLDQQPAR